MRVRRESGRLLSHVSHLSGVSVADVAAALVAALGGPERAAAEVLRQRLAALGLGGDGGGADDDVILLARTDRPYGR